MRTAHPVISSGAFYANTSTRIVGLLFAITRNTGFETDKGHLGECFVINCCEWNSRQSDDICGLDNKKIDAAEKAELLVEHSILKKVFERLETE